MKEVETYAHLACALWETHRQARLGATCHLLLALRHPGLARAPGAKAGAGKPIADRPAVLSSQAAAGRPAHLKGFPISGQRQAASSATQKRVNDRVQPQGGLQLMFSQCRHQCSLLPD